MKNHSTSPAHGPVPIGRVVRKLRGREMPAISEQATVEEAIDRMVQFPHSRLLYVVDGQRRLIGTVSLGNLVRHFFSHSHEPEVHPRSLLSMITTETVRDMMARRPVVATEAEDVESVLKKMVEKNLAEIAVVDEEERLIADVTMIDLLCFLIPERKQRR
jgi:CBS domain-containing protein